VVGATVPGSTSADHQAMASTVAVSRSARMRCLPRVEAVTDAHMRALRPVTAVDDGTLFAALYPSLRRFAAVTAPSDVEPDDLLQEAVARTLRRGPLHRLDDPGAYLRRTMVNLASNHRRSWARRRQAESRMDPATAVSASYPSDLADLDHLSPQSRAEVEGMSFADIAQVIGCREATARTKASRARRTLRTSLSKEDHDHG